MSASYSSNAGIVKPGTGDRNWDVSINSNADLLDRLSGVGWLAVIPRENPSSSLIVRIAPGPYRAPDGTAGYYAGPGFLTLPASSASSVWIDTASGLPIHGASFPASPHVPLATVTTGATTVTAVADLRVMATSVRGSSGLPLPTLTTAQRDAIVGPTEGLLIWNITTHQPNVYDGSSWRILNLT